MNILNVAMILDHAAQQSPTKNFISHDDQDFTFAEIDKESQRFANVLAGLGVRPGEKVALLLPNVPLFPICYYGTLKLGAVPVPLSVMSPDSEIAYYLEDSNASVLVSVSAFSNTATKSFIAAECCRNLILEGKKTDGHGHENAHYLYPLMKEAKEIFKTKTTQPDDPAVILYTSGTSGRPKGAVLTHLNCCFFAGFVAQNFWKINIDDIILMIAPGFHVFGQVILNSACAVQAKIVMMNRFTPKAFLKRIEKKRITFFAGVPALAQVLLQSSMAGQYNLDSLRLAMLGGAPVHVETIQQLKNQLHMDVITGYGLTEGVPLAFISPDMKEVPPNSVGKQAFGTTIRVVNKEGKEVPAGDLGEIIARGPQIFQGYLNRPNASAAALKNGWFYTGDVGYMDENDCLFIVDRLKDMIKTRGYTVYPAEVERIIVRHQAISEVAVLGIPHETRGEIVTAFAVLGPEKSVSPRELKIYCKKHLADYKCPRDIVFLDALPKNPQGKVLRRELRERSV